MAKLRNIAFILFAALMSACSTTKYLQPNQKLYGGGKVNIVDKQNSKKGDIDPITDDLTSLLRPAPNSTILGLRFKLWVYFKTRTNKVRGLKHYLNTHFGEPPVYAKSVDLVRDSVLEETFLQEESSGALLVFRRCHRAMNELAVLLIAENQVRLGNE